MTIQNPTDSYGWILPTEGGSDDTWGTELNEMMAEAAGAAIESIDTVLAGLQVELDAEQLRITDADERTFRLEGSAPRPAYARVWLGTDQVFTDNTAAFITSWTEDFDKNDMFDTSTPSRLTIPSTFDGLFTIRGVIRVPMSSGSSDDSPIWYARITKNVGETVMSEARTPFLNAGYSDDGSIGDQTLIVECVVDAAGGDYFELELYTRIPSTGSGAATRSVVAGVQNTYFEIYRHRSPVVSIPASTAGVKYTANPTPGTSHDVDMPDEDRTAGQMLVAIWNSYVIAVPGGNPAGWTRLYSWDTTTTGGIAWYRRITSAEAGGTGGFVVTTGVSRESTACVLLVNDPHPDDDPEGEFDDAGPGASVTPSWGTEQTLYIHGSTGLPSTGVDPYAVSAVPTGYTATDVLVADPDTKDTGDDAGSVGVAVATKAAAGGAEDPDGWVVGTGTEDGEFIIAVRGAVLT